MGYSAQLFSVHVVLAYSQRARCMRHECTERQQLRLARRCVCVNATRSSATSWHLGPYMRIYIYCMAYIQRSIYRPRGHVGLQQYNSTASSFESKHGRRATHDDDPARRRGPRPGRIYTL